MLMLKKKKENGYVLHELDAVIYVYYTILHGMLYCTKLVYIYARYTIQNVKKKTNRVEKLCHTICTSINSLLLFVSTLR